MGNILNYTRGVKRKLNDDEEDSNENDSELEKSLHTPKRKKLLCTARYIYHTLFQEGRDSDITLVALGKQWKLHKVYLCQSPYFSSMFSGSWKESLDDVIHIDVVDRNITIDALRTVLGALYRPDVAIEPAEAVSILAAATLFQLEGLIEQCVNIMTESINIHTVIRYYDASHEYGTTNIGEKCKEWLLVNLLSAVSESPKQLCLLGSDLLCDLIKDPNLVAIQTEFSIYVLLKMWVFLQLHPLWDGSTRDLMFDTNKHFLERQHNDNTPFILTANGREYGELFYSLRMQHLMNHHLDFEMVFNDNIIPPSTLHMNICTQWHIMLRVDQSIDTGVKDMSTQDFNSSCMRCARVITSSSQHMWRWTGFNSGLDLVLIWEDGLVRMKRHHKADHNGLLCFHSRRHLMYRVTIYCLDNQRQSKFTQATGIKSITLSRNEEVDILRIEQQNVTYPVLLSFNVLTVNPIVAERNGQQPTVQQQST